MPPKKQRKSQAAGHAAPQAKTRPSGSRRSRQDRAESLDRTPRAAATSSSNSRLGPGTLYAQNDGLQTTERPSTPDSSTRAPGLRRSQSSPPSPLTVRFRGKSRTQTSTRHEGPALDTPTRRTHAPNAVTVAASPSVPTYTESPGEDTARGRQATRPTQMRGSLFRSDSLYRSVPTQDTTVPLPPSPSADEDSDFDVFGPTVTPSHQLRELHLGDSFAAPRYGVPKKTSLLNILEQPPPSHPKFYRPNGPPIDSEDSGEPHVLTSTKGISARALACAANRRINWIVRAPDMLDNFISEVEDQTDEIWFSWANTEEQVALAFINSWSARLGLPAVIHCEKDTEQWVLCVFLRAALTAWRIVQKGLDHPLAKWIFDQSEEGPFWTAGDQNGTEKALPDFILVSNWESHEERKVPIAVEVKCHNVLRIHEEMDHEELKHENHVRGWTSIWQSLKSKEADADDRTYKRALPFVWPSSSLKRDNDVLTRLLVQISMEMIDNVDLGPLGRLGILTSYESTVFFVMRGDILYLSREYGVGDMPMLAVYAFLCAAMGTYPGVDFDLPEDVDTQWTGDRLAALDRQQPPARSGIPFWAMP